jgi:signal transduction histidine kinase
VVGALSPAALTVFLGALGTLLVILVPGLHFAYRTPELRVALETTAALVALLAAGLVYARLRHSGRLDDLLLALALGLLAETNLCFSAGPLAFVDGRAESFSSWATPFGQLAGALVLAGASVAPARVLRRRVAAELAGIAVLAGVLVGISVPLLLAHPAIPASLSPAANLDLANPHVVAQPLVLVLHLAALGAFAFAALGYARRAAAARDSLISAIAIGAVLAAFARVNYVLFPAFSTHWIYTGDAYRLAFYLVVLVGAALEIRRHWRATAQTAVLEERRRIARDLHDTVAQELAFIARNVGRAGRDAAVRDRVVAAAERALADSRRGIAALTRPLDEPVALELEEALEEISDRLDCRVHLSLADGVAVEQDVRHALVRIACEAVANAARHAGGSCVSVELENSMGVRMRITDDGRGFDPGHGARGFGLTSMREWADAIGADFTIRSRPGVGTEVEVILP